MPIEPGTAEDGGVPDGRTRGCASWPTAAARVLLGSRNTQIRKRVRPGPRVPSPGRPRNGLLIDHGTTEVAPLRIIGEEEDGAPVQRSAMIVDVALDETVAACVPGGHRQDDQDAGQGEQAGAHPEAHDFHGTMPKVKHEVEGIYEYASEDPSSSCSFMQWACQRRPHNPSGPRRISGLVGTQAERSGIGRSGGADTRLQYHPRRDAPMAAGLASVGGSNHPTPGRSTGPG